MASYAPSTVTPESKTVEIPLQPVEGEAEESPDLLSVFKKISHGRALLALALFFPTGIIALFYSLQESRHVSRGNVEGAAKAAERAEKLTVISYRVGVATLVSLALLLIAAVVWVLCDAIDEAHVGDRF